MTPNSCVKPKPSDPEYSTTSTKVIEHNEKIKGRESYKGRSDPDSSGSNVMKFIRYIAISLAGMSCAYFFITSFFDMFAIDKIRELGLGTDGSLEVRLYFLHLVLAALTFGLLCSWRIKSHIRKFVSLTACIGILAVYVMWFLEKYSFLKEVWGLKEGSADYELYLSEFGMLRGATSADYLFSVFALASVILALGLILATSIWKTDQP